MAKRSTRKTDSSEREAEEADRSSDTTRAAETADNQSGNTDSPIGGKGRAGRSGPAQQSAVGRAPSRTRDNSHSSGGEYVSYERGPDPETLSTRYGMEVRESQAGKLQRLEGEFGRDRVNRWAEEGMTVETMGRPQDMQAFRKRQEKRPEEVPTDVERRNEASVHRNSSRNSEEGPAGTTGVPEEVRSVISSPGRSMDGTVQREMETKMGGDFSDVQLHTGPKAAAAAESINARAFTVGNHVAFNNGEYQPDSDSGKRTLAHELTHVRQQTTGRMSLLPKTEARHPGQVTVNTDAHVRPKLEVSSPDDPVEKEAEEVADLVVSATNNENNANRNRQSKRGQRRIENASAVPSVSPTGGAGTGAVSGNLESEVRGAVRSGGKPLPSETQTEMESKIGADFSDVSVHTDARADAAAKSIGAKAYTLGSDIAFTEGSYNPDSKDGKKLLAHELTHVAQQQDGSVRSSVDRQTIEDGMEVSDNQSRRNAVMTRINSTVNVIQAFLTNLRSEFGTAVDALKNHIVFPDNVETKAEPMKKLKEKIINDITSYGVDQVMEKVPHSEWIQKAFSYVDVMVQEVKRAEKAETGVKVRNFLNTTAKTAEKHFSRLQKETASPDFTNAIFQQVYNQAIDGDQSPEAIAQNFYEQMPDKLETPGIETMQQKITKSYINYMSQANVLHIDGKLFITWYIDADEEKVESHEMKLQVPNGEAIRDSMVETLDNTTVETEYLNIKRGVKFEDTTKQHPDYVTYWYEPGQNTPYEENGSRTDLTEYVDDRFPKMDWKSVTVE